MTLLPIADRELRVSARNKATHRLRLLFAMGAFVIGGGIALISRTGGGLAGSWLGLWIFNVLKWISFIFACSAGIFLTSDCLSEEKREGTLGLLFLTDLRGHDVVLGKLFATSLRTFYSLLAIFPVMALSFVLGGIAGDVFRQTLLSVCNALFFSLALGMAVSVVSRDPHKAMTGTLVAMAAFLFFGPVVDSRILHRNSFNPLFELLSPAFAFIKAGSYQSSNFWRSMLVVHLAGWILLAVASWLAPRTWHEKGMKTTFRAVDTRGPGRKLLARNPICWIISRDRWTARLARLAILLVLMAFVLSVTSLWMGSGSKKPSGLLASHGPVTSSTKIVSSNGTTTYVQSTSWSSGLTTNLWYKIASGFSSVLTLALEFWLASQICRFYVDGRRSGFLELLLVTPVRQANIFTGHWLALRRLFLTPLAAQFILTLVCGVIQMRASLPPPPAAPGVSSPPASNLDFEIQQAITLGLGTINWGIGLWTIAWFSIWTGLTSKKITTAMLKTFCYAKVLPWFGMSFVSAFLFMGLFTTGIFSSNSTWLVPALFELLFIALNLALIHFARHGARSAFAAWPNLTA